MLRKTGLLVLVFGLAFATVVGSGYPQVSAQEGPQASTAYQINMRTGPGPNYDVVTILDPGVALFLEARNDDTSWLLSRTADGAARGWVASLYLQYQPGFSAVNLPVSGEVVGAAAPAPAAEDAPQSESAPPAPSGDTSAYTSYQLNVRSGSGTGHRVIGQVNGNTPLVLEARNADSSWVLAHTPDGSVRGWFASLYLKFTGVSASSLPFSDETVSVGAAGGGDASGEAPSAHVSYEGVNMAGYDPARIEGINLADYPIVGNATGRAHAIFLEGQRMGNNPNVIAKVGDCSSEHWFFLKPFTWGQYNLGNYGDLQGVIDHFGASMDVDSEATHNGYNVNTVQAPEWANPAVCEAGESPLLCEYRIRKPSAAIIMFGTSDLIIMTPYEFDFYYRYIIQQTIDAGVIPILSTFPGNQAFPNRTLIFNQIVVRLALDFDLPLINLWLALEDLPNEGLEGDGFHLGVPLDDPGNLSGANLQTGYPVRNLVTLQTLDKVWRGAMQ